eukprot:366460-Chlamydomonas_euryale.AAC.8
MRRLIAATALATVPAGTDVRAVSGTGAAALTGRLGTFGLRGVHALVTLSCAPRAAFVAASALPALPGRLRAVLMGCMGTYLDPGAASAGATAARQGSFAGGCRL